MTRVHRLEALCTGSFKECNMQALSAIRTMNIRQDIRKTVKNCSKIMPEEKCLQTMFSSDYFWAK